MHLLWSASYLRILRLLYRKKPLLFSYHAHIQHAMKFLFIPPLSEIAAEREGQA